MILQDRYRILAPLGRGAMGTVFLALDERTEKHVAIKELAIPESGNAEVARGWFKREVKALMVLEHPGVLRLLDHGEGPAHERYVVTELLDGVDCATAVLNAGVMPVGVAVALASQALAALEAAHASGIIHRDLKPANLFLCRSGRVVLLDFGLARGIGSSAGATLAVSFNTQIVGTPDYFPPEMLEGSQFLPAGDLFSLGGTLYHLVSGKRPFPGDGLIATAAAIVSNKRVPLNEATPGLPASFCELIESMLAIDPSLRPTAAQARTDFLFIARELGAVDQLLMSYAQIAAVESTSAAAPAIDTASDSARDTVRDTLRDTAPAQATSIATLPMTTKSGVSTPRANRAPVIAATVAVLAVMTASTVWILRQPAPEPSAALAPVAADEASSAPATGMIEPAPPPPQTEPTPAVVEPPTAAAPPRPQRRSAEALPGDKQGTVQCALRQWAEVYVDGRSIGKKQNAVKLELPAGKHSLAFRNDAFGLRDTRVLVRANEMVRVEVDFEKGKP